eukprot:RCo015441
MALQFLEDGRECVLAKVAAKDRRAMLLETFANDFASRGRLRHPPEIGDFCPIRTTAVVISFLGQITLSLPLVKLRVMMLLIKTRRSSPGSAATYKPGTKT